MSVTLCWRPWGGVWRTCRLCLAELGAQASHTGPAGDLASELPLWGSENPGAAVRKAQETHVKGVKSKDVLLTDPRTGVR